ncbi:hypothetical protein LguiA_021299 [Lonicera macranthoides]
MGVEMQIITHRELDIEPLSASRKYFRRVNTFNQLFLYIEAKATLHLGCVRISEKPQDLQPYFGCYPFVTPLNS